EDGHTAKPVFYCRFGGGWISIPDKNETKTANWPPISTWEASSCGVDRFAIHEEHSHDQKRNGPPQHMLHEVAIRIAPFSPVLKSTGNGEPDNEDKRGKNDIGKTHPVNAGVDVPKPGRNACQRPQVVYKYHQHHRQRAENVNGGDALSTRFDG